MPTKSVSPRPGWQSALRWGKITAGIPLIGGLALMPLGGDLAVGGHWIAFAGIFGSPAFFVLGAIGGAVAHRLSPPPSAPALAHREGSSRRAVRIWTTLGALAGYGASELTMFRWPVIGGSLIGLALVPVWMWVGIAGARRTLVMAGRVRAIAKAAITGAAAYVLVQLPFMFMAVPRGVSRGMLRTVLLGIAVSTTVTAYFAFVAADRRPEPPAQAAG